MSGNDAQTRVAIMAASEQNHSRLSSLLSEAGLNVVMQQVAGEDFIRQLDQTSADVLLVDLGDDAGSEVDIIDTLLEYDSLPIFFNDSSKDGSEADALWAKKLARRLQQLVRDFEPEIVLEPAIELEAKSKSSPESESTLALEPVTDDQESSDTASGLALELESPLDLDNAEDMELASEFEDLVDSDQPVDSGKEMELSMESRWDTRQETAQFSGNNSEPGFVTENNDQLGYGQDADYSLDAGSFRDIEDEISEAVESLPQQTDTAIVAVKEESTLADLPEGAAVNVWVLGASLGGPQAVRQFLMAVREDLPVAFVLAQHIGENHISLLAEQLDRISKFKVFPGYNGHMIRHHEVILAPAGKNLHVTDDGYISLSDQAENAIYSPCINDVMAAIAERYGSMAGTIVFSGMGDDGAIGCQAMADKGGIVWAQDVDSCVISSMPDQARKTNNVTFSANPRRLADELYKYYME